MASLQRTITLPRFAQAVLAAEREIVGRLKDESTLFREPRRC